MATATTFQGKPKPMGRSGHYYESRRHELQAKGIHTGTHTEPSKPVISFGIIPEKTYKELDKIYNKPAPSPDPEVNELEEAEEQYLENPEEPEVEYEPTEVIEKKPHKNVIKEVIAGYKAEQEARGRALREKAFEDVGREEEADEEGEEEEPEFEGGGMKFGKILADLTGDYRSSDLVGLTDSELEELAVKFDSTATGLFGKPQNPFLEELRKRITSRETVKLEKAKLEAELEEPRQRIQQEIAEIRKRSMGGGGSSGGSIFSEELKAWRS